MVELNERMIAEMAVGTTLMDGRGLVKKGAYRQMGKTADGTLIFAQCKGSGSNTFYDVSMDLSAGARPHLRCNCPSRPRPCKHGIGLMLAYLERATEFVVSDAPAALQERRDQAPKRAPRRAGSTGEVQPRAANLGARAKKAGEQLTALATLETFLIDMVSPGLGSLNENSAKTIQNQMKRLSDADLSGAHALLQHLLLLLPNAPAVGKKAAKQRLALPEEERLARLAAVVTQLWATIRKGRQTLERLRENDASQAQADAYIETLLGRRWQLSELKEAGYWITDRNLIELAHERVDDDLTEMTVTTGYLLDLADGAILLERSIIPYQAQKSPEVKHRTSFGGVLHVKEAALYPGALINRRIRWDEDAGATTERARAADDYRALHRHALSIKQALAAFRDQLKNPLVPREAVVMIAATRIGMLADDTIVMEDDEGTRMACRDPRDTLFPTTVNLRHAAAAHGPGSVVARLWFDLRAQAIFAQPLALFVGETHLRLGL